MNIEDYKKLEPFSLNKIKKKKIFENLINYLTVHHYKKSKEYKKILDFFGYKFNKKELSEIPFLPAKLFKEFELSDEFPFTKLLLENQKNSYVKVFKESINKDILETTFLKLSKRIYSPNAFGMDKPVDTRNTFSFLRR